MEWNTENLDLSVLTTVILTLVRAPVSHCNVVLEAASALIIMMATALLQKWHVKVMIILHVIGFVCVE